MLARNVREDIVREEEDTEIEERWKESRERTKYFINKIFYIHSIKNVSFMLNILFKIYFLINILTVMV